MKIQTLIIILLVTLITIGIIITAEPPIQALGGFWFLNNDYVQINTTASGGINRINVSEIYGTIGCGNITGSPDSDFCTDSEGSTADIWINESGDTMTGNLTIIANLNVTGNITPNNYICSNDGCTKWIVLNSTGVYIQG